MPSSLPTFLYLSDELGKPVKMIKSCEQVLNIEANKSYEYRDFSHNLWIIHSPFPNESLNNGEKIWNNKVLDVDNHNWITINSLKKRTYIVTQFGLYKP